eukprot:2529994-Rhodomonas_salina.2
MFSATDVANTTGSCTRTKTVSTERGRSRGAGDRERSERGIEREKEKRKKKNRKKIKETRPEKREQSGSGARKGRRWRCRCRPTVPDPAPRTTLSVPPAVPHSTTLSVPRTYRVVQIRTTDHSYELRVCDYISQLQATRIASHPEIKRTETLSSVRVSDLRAVKEALDQRQHRALPRTCPPSRPHNPQSQRQKKS